MVKNYMLDTNVLCSNPNAFFEFEDNNVWLCGTILQELDKFKEEKGTERGYNARNVCKILDRLREDGLALYVDKSASREVQRKQTQSIFSYEAGCGIPLESGGKLYIEPDGVSEENVPKGYSLSSPDNRIISSCVHMNKSYLKDNPVILLTNDVSNRVNSTVCGVEVQGVKNDLVEDTDYTGHRDYETIDYSLIDELYKYKEIDVPSDLDDLKENEFVTIHSGTQSALSVHQNGKLKLIEKEKIHLINGVKPLNKMQTYAMWALTNPDIPLVILEGPAGTSKTFVSSACGLSQIPLDEQDKSTRYKRLMISRPNKSSSDDDFGFLPGDLAEKMGPLLSSYYDNIEEILKGKSETPMSEIRMQIEDLMEQKLIEITPLYTIRGRSIHNSFLICDEAQNAGKNLVRDVITRAGRNCKIVVAGDPRQVDAPTLSRRNNGLVYAASCMIGSSNCAYIKFANENCVRSELAEDAIQRMK